jgi:nicotinamide-nucleotide amidase
MSGPPRSEPRQTAAIVAVGDELLGGAHPDLNGPWLAAELEELGIAVEHVHVVGDDELALAELLRELCAIHVLVVTTGGLGPTPDDITRHAAARALGARLEHHEPSWARIVALFAERGRVASDGNRRQALFPAGATVLENGRGTAPGFACATERADGSPGLLASLPGPPGELQPMARTGLFPRVALDLVVEAERPVVGRLSLWGIGESDFAAAAGDWLDRSTDPVMGVCARAGVLVLKATSKGDGARARVDARLDELRARFAAQLVSSDHAELEGTLVAELRAAGLRLAVAESCTGGRLAGALTDVPGASAVFEAGFVTYANHIKSSVLGVPEELLRTHGAVSAQVAAAMARGARERAGADLGVSTTGVAGPDGGSADKPVGLVIFGLATADGAFTLTRRFPAVGRERIRRYAVQQALALALWAVRGRLGELDLELDAGLDGGPDA